MSKAQYAVKQLMIKVAFHSVFSTTAMHFSVDVFIYRAHCPYRKMLINVSNSEVFLNDKDRIVLNSFSFWLIGIVGAGLVVNDSWRQFIRSTWAMSSNAGVCQPRNAPIFDDTQFRKSHLEGRVVGDGCTYLKQFGIIKRFI